VSVGCVEAKRRGWSIALVSALLFAPTLRAAVAAEPLASTEPRLATAVFAGGCFWCMEPPFDKLVGVVRTTSGYTGGHQRNPTYEEVSAGTTGHTEAIEVTYDPVKISYQQLLDVFWKNVDPVAVDRQFCDVGRQYRSGIHFRDAAERAAASASKTKLEESGRFDGVEIATEIVAATTFYPAEEYHQDYYVKNPLRYKYYRWGCGRDQRLEEIWGPQPTP
jgi:peptide-methionine (S)-S-oxide reductase